MRKKKEQSQEPKGKKFDQGMNTAQKVATLLGSIATLILTTITIKNSGKNRDM